MTRNFASVERSISSSRQVSLERRQGRTYQRKIMGFP